MKLRVTCGEADFWAGLNEHIEENNRMQNTRDFFKKIRDTKGTFHAKWALYNEISKVKP